MIILNAEEKFYKVYTRYLQICGMKGKYCSVYNIKIKRYLDYYMVLFCTMTMHGQTLSA